MHVVIGNIMHDLHRWNYEMKNMYVGMNEILEMWFMYVMDDNSTMEWWCICCYINEWRMNER